ncbi:MAG: site-specific integrase [Anaerolineae bacterium]|nr:site-specific integrase [Anaerolineae bacterium]
MSDQAITATSVSAIQQIGQVANAVAANHTFADYRDRKADNTLRRQDADLALFADYLAAVGIVAGELHTDLAAWQGITWGLVAGFVQWMLHEGYATGSVNVRLSTIKTYAKLASKAGALDKLEYLQIKDVTGYSHKECKRLDEKRIESGAVTRRGNKKAEAVRISIEQAKALKNSQSDTPQGRRDAMLMCLLIDHGLRCGEVALLDVTHVDLKAGELKFYRPKVDKVQTHRLTTDTKRAMQKWFDTDVPAVGPLLRASRKGGHLTSAGMTERAITKRVEYLGAQIGVQGLSAHDCRHYWATTAARKGTDPFRLQEAGGWNSLAMPRRYVETAKIANAGVILEE